MATPHDIHGSTPLLHAGAAVADAKVAVLLLHGRGGSAEDMLALARAFTLPADVALLAPQAAGHTWYPERFIAPLAANEPQLTSALARVGAVLAQLATQGVAQQRVLLGGFSQGACLALEFALRHGGRFGGLAGLSGGLIGPPGHTWDAYQARLEGTPVLLGCSDVDAHIPLWRVHESADVLGQRGATVDVRIYPGMGHTVNDDEVGALRAMLGALVGV